ncbi:MAG: CHAT domain-containing protein [Saprospiraceae bacterium]|nr:CHAT domain-containing protein [Saprospiraceae bacterium]
MKLFIPHFPQSPQAISSKLIGFLALVFFFLLLAFQKPNTKHPDDFFAQGLKLLKQEHIHQSKEAFLNAQAGYLQQKQYDKMLKAAYYAARIDNRTVHQRFDMDQLEQVEALGQQYLADDLQNEWKGRVWIAKGVDFRENEATDSAHYYLDKARTYFSNTQHWQALVEASFFLARTYKFIPSKGKAAKKKELDFTYQIVRQHLASDDFWTGEVLYYLGSRYMNHLDSAHAFLLEAQAIHLKNEDWNSYLKSTMYLAEYELEQEDDQKMRIHIHEMLDCVKKHKTWERRMQEVYQYAGKYYHQIGDYEKALEYYYKVFDYIQKDSVYLAYHHYDVGNMLLEKNDIAKAKDHLQEALFVIEDHPFHQQQELIPEILSSFGIIEERQKRWEKARYYHIQAIQSAHKLIESGDDEYFAGLNSIITSNIAMARIFLHHKQYDSVLSHLEENMEIYKDHHYHKHSTLMTFGDYYQQLDEYNKANHYFLKAEQECIALHGNRHPDLAKIYWHQGLNFQLQKNHDAALDDFQKGLSSLGLTSLNPAEINFSSITDLNIFRQIAYSTAVSLHEQKREQEAYAWVKVALNAIRVLQNTYKAEGSKLFIQQQAAPTYELGINLALDLYQTQQTNEYLETAFQYAEENRALLLLNALKSDEARQFGNVPDSLLAQEQNLIQNLAFYKKQLFEANLNKDKQRIITSQEKILFIKNKIDALHDIFENKYPKYYELKYAQKIASLREIQASLDTQTQILEYFVGEQYVYLFSITKEDTKALRLSKSTFFDAEVEDLFSSITNISLLKNTPKKAYSFFTTKAYSVYQNFVKPALSKEAKRIVVIPDGQLYHIPFEALLVEEVKQKMPYNQLPYLIHQYTFNYHYSSSLMLHHKDLYTNKKGDILAFAASYSYPDSLHSNNRREDRLRKALVEIPGTHIEVQQLNEQFNGTFLHNSSANESSFQKLAQDQHYSVLHLAMHGVVDKENPDYSSLVFTKTPHKGQVDDLLHAYELNILELKTNLVVLSACETGYGKYEKGEGVLSIGRGFMYAGVPSIVMTLWPLSDKSSPILIQDFYTHLAKHVPKDQALRQAKLNYLQTSQDLAGHPFFWASFITLGDPKSIRLDKRGNFWTEYWWLWSGSIIFLLILILWYRFKIGSKALPLKAN